VALDVEYIHFESAGESIVMPGEVCVVNTHHDVLYHSFCRPGSSYFDESSCVELVEHSQYQGSQFFCKLNICHTQMKPYHTNVIKEVCGKAVGGMHHTLQRLQPGHPRRFMAGCWWGTVCGAT